VQNLIGLTLRLIGLTRSLPAYEVGHCGLTFVAMESETKTKVVAIRRGGGRAFRSRVEPFVAIIREKRKQRKTWREIAEWLAAEESCRITLQGLHQFYRRYVKRQDRHHWEVEGMALPVAPTLPHESAIRPESNRKPVLAATPASRSFRQPSPDSLNLNDPNKL
jgi:hypothetical protein